ncbi:MAG: multicopper oxidase domain-containing protein [Thiohalomonadales bacterium]
MARLYRAFYPRSILIMVRYQPPLIKAKVGDTLIVYFSNNLPETTTIHWHGLRLPADMNGSTVAQNPILPGEPFFTNTVTNYFLASNNAE